MSESTLGKHTRKSYAKTDKVPKLIRGYGDQGRDSQGCDNPVNDSLAKQSPTTMDLSTLYTYLTPKSPTSCNDKGHRNLLSIDFSPIEAFKESFSLCGS